MPSSHIPETQATFTIEQNSLAEPLLGTRRFANGTRIEQHSAEIKISLSPAVSQERLILESLLEDLDARAKVMQRVRAVEDISQAPKHQRREKIKLWADRLEVHPRTVTRLLERVEQEGLASLVRFTRIDAGEQRGSKQWQGKSVAEWTDFILTTYKRGNKNSRRMSRSQTFNQVKAHALEELGLAKNQGEYPSIGFVYSVLNPLVEKKKPKKNPGQGPGIVIKTIDKDNVREDIVTYILVVV